MPSIASARSSVVPAPSARVRDRALFAELPPARAVHALSRERDGLAWAFVHPLVLLVVYHFVFTTMFRTERFGNESFLAFVAVALWPWLAAQEGIQRGATSLGSYAGLIRKVAFPHELVVYASVCATLMLHLQATSSCSSRSLPMASRCTSTGLLLAIPLWIVLAIGVVGHRAVLRRAAGVRARRRARADADAHDPHVPRRPSCIR